MALSLVAPRDVGVSIESMHAPIREMLLLLGADSPDHAKYRTVHASMSRAYLGFVNAARHSLNPSSKPFDSLVGGPPPWHMVEQWLPRADGSVAGSGTT